jgi:hypothetical protein
MSRERGHASEDDDDEEEFIQEDEAAAGGVHALTKEIRIHSHFMHPRCM